MVGVETYLLIILAVVVILSICTIAIHVLCTQTNAIYTTVPYISLVSI